jgi:hypothetical protein
MTPEDLTRLQDIVEKSADPELKSAFKEAALAILRGPVKDEARKERAEQREEAKFQVATVLAIIGGVLLLGLLAAGQISVSQASLAGVVTLVSTYVANYFGLKLPAKKD